MRYKRNPNSAVIWAGNEASGFLSGQGGVYRYYIHPSDGGRGFCVERQSGRNYLWGELKDGCATMAEAKRVAEESEQQLRKSLSKRSASSNPVNPVAFSRSTDVQTLLFPKDRFTVASARAWAEHHDFRAGKVDTGSATATRLRVRQREPGDFQKGSFRTILLDSARGVEAVIGKPAVRKNPTEVVFSKESNYGGRKVFEARVEGSSWDAPRVSVAQVWGISKHGATKGQRMGPADDWMAHEGTTFDAISGRGRLLGRGTKKEMKAIAKTFLLGAK